MKHILTKLALSFALLLALTVLVKGTASAQTITTTHQTVTTGQAQVVTPDCGYAQESNWTWSTSYGNVNIIKWKNTCNGNYHCEAIDKTYYGAIYNVGIWLQLNTDQGAYSYVYKYPFQENQIVNTPALPSGYTGYTCSPSVLYADPLTSSSGISD